MKESTGSKNGVRGRSRNNRAPTRTGNPKKWEGIFQSGKSQGILNRLEKSVKITQNSGKDREFQTNVIYYFLVIFK